jgi:hypothetical protein
LVVFDASNTPFSVKYENLTAILAKAIQAIAGISGAFRDALIAWFGDAGNGIGDLFATTIHADNVIATTGTFQTLCVGDTSSGKTCVTKDQLDRLLEKQSVSPTAPPTAAFAVPSNSSADATTSAPSAPAATATTASALSPTTTLATSTLPVVEAPTLVPDYTATTTIPAASSSPATVTSSTVQ